MKDLTTNRKKLPFIDALVHHRRTTPTGGSGFILGLPGSGKTTLAEEQIHSILRNSSDTTVVIDTTGAYLALAEALDGQILRLAPGSTGSSVHINPFDLCPAEPDPEAIGTKAKCISAWFEILLGAPFGLSVTQRSIIERCVEAAYEPYMASGAPTTGERDARLLPNLAGFYRLLRAQGGFDAYLLAEALDPFVNGAYDSFSSASDTPHTGRLVVYDLSGLDGAIGTSYALLVLDHIWRSCVLSAETDNHTWIFMDDVYTLLRSGVSASYVSILYHRSQLYRCVFTGIMQAASDLLRQESANFLLTHSPYFHMLRLSTLDREHFGRLFQLEKRMSWVDNAPPRQGLVFLDDKTFTTHDSDFTEVRAKAASAPTLPCAFTYDFDAACQLKSELDRRIPGIHEKLSVREMDDFIDFVCKKTCEDLRSRGLLS